MHRLTGVESKTKTSISDRLHKFYVHEIVCVCQLMGGQLEGEEGLSGMCG